MDISLVSVFSWSTYSKSLFLSLSLFLIILLLSFDWLFNDQNLYAAENP